MLGLTDAQLEIITTAANAVPVECRSVFSGACRCDAESARALFRRRRFRRGQAGNGRTDPARRRQRGVCVKKNPGPPGGMGMQGARDDYVSST